MGWCAPELCIMMSEAIFSQKFPVLCSSIPSRYLNSLHGQVHCVPRASIRKWKVIHI